MSRLHRVVGLVLALLIASVFTAPVARADDDTPRDWRIDRYDATVVTDAAGNSEVTVEFDFNFGDTPGHGPFIVLVQRQADDRNPDVWRMVDITLNEVSSPTGAPANVERSVEDGQLMLKVGSRGTKVRGVQTYRMSYTARGLITPQHAESGLDELNWNAVGTGWQVPIREVTVRAQGPVPATRTACFSGSSYDQPCGAGEQGEWTSYGVGYLEPGEGMQIVAGYPAGTFTGAEARTEKRYHLGNLFEITPASLGLTGGLSALAIAAVLAAVRRGSRDEVYVGLTPGVRPAPGQDAAVGLASGDPQVTVQFTPPAGVTPGEIGVLRDGNADNVDVTATILDLAARGHFQIAEAGKKHWRFIARDTNDPLTDAEQHIVSTMFSRGDEVTTKELRKKHYHELLSGGQQRLKSRVVGELKWFKGDPTAAVVGGVVAGAALVFAGVAVGAWLAVTWGWGLVGLAGVAAGLVLMVKSGSFGRRTAEGSAVLAQARGFEQYLTTAEADQIRFEEGIDVFSRYLPYATVFGVADRWAKVFEQLAQQGRYSPATSWYVGDAAFDAMRFSMISNSLSSQLTSSMQSAVNAQSSATSGSSGGSGFSGGGGAGGGGGGGW